MGAILTIDANRTSPSDNAARVHAATLGCIARFGLSKSTLDDIARESGVSRATIYRTFPGGREVLLQSVLMAEISRFFEELASVLTELDEFEDLLTAGLARSMRFLREHEALRTIVELEPGLLLPQFAFHRLDLVLAHAAGFAAPFLEPHVGPASNDRASNDRASNGGGSNRGGSNDAAWSAAEHLVRIVLSYTMHPSVLVDPSDDESIRRLVRHHVLPGLEPGPHVPHSEGIIHD